MSTKKSLGRPKKVKRGRKTRAKLDASPMEEEMPMLNEGTPNDRTVLPRKRRFNSEPEQSFSIWSQNVVVLSSQESESPPSSTQNSTNVEVPCTDKQYGDIFGKIELLSQDSTTSSDEKVAEKLNPSTSTAKTGHNKQLSAVVQAPRVMQSAPDQDESMQCIATGTKHQGYLRGGNNMQCVVMSSCGFAYSFVKRPNILTTTDVDNVLDHGNKIYLNFLCGALPRLIEPEELPLFLKIGNYKINVKKPEWVFNHAYAKDTSDFFYTVNKLGKKLVRKVFGDNERSVNDGFLFTGLGYTISFWRHSHSNDELREQNEASATISRADADSDVFYVFNSHAVDETGVINKRRLELNRARLFKVRGIYNLAFLLLKNSKFESSHCEYSVHHIKVESFVQTDDVQPLVASPSRDEYLDGKLTTTVKPTVIHETIIQSENETKKKIGRPKKIKRGRKKQTENSHLAASTKYNATHPEVHREAVTRYSQSHTEVHREAVARYSQSHPEMNREAVARYTESHPEVNRNAVARYSQSHPEVHREAVARYTESHPEVNREAVARYTESHPEVNREAVARYTESHPEVNRNAVARYTNTHSDTHREAAARYRETHREEIRESNARYNRTERGVAPELRRSGLLGEKSGSDLNVIIIHSLKKTNLQNADIFRCPHCNAILFEEEKSRTQWCCGSGRNNILHLPPIDERFYRDQQFVKFARPYNNLFAFSALGVSHGFHHPQTGLAFIKIQGRVYHRVFDLAYAESTNPIGLYIDDGEERKRLAENRNLNQDILQEITDYLNRVNPFINCFKRLSEEPSEEAHLVFEHTTRRTHGNILGDMPRGTEVAAILSTEQETYVPKSICIWKIGDRRPHTVDIFHPLYEAFQYPLLYPHGGSGWTINTVNNNGQKLTQVKYYRCLLLSEPRFSQLGRLSEEWAISVFCRVDEERLRYIANSQKRNSTTELRSAPLDEVQNANVARQIAEDETVQGEGGVVPGRIYLPNTFTGGPRYMKNKYMDAMAIVNRLGKPSYFLTITCNPKWPEIQQNTPSNATQPPASLCARVFNLKLQQLLRDLQSGTWFGKCEYLMYVIEFQKRGLPHAHICFRVHGGGPVQNIDIDKFIRADIPLEHETEGRLRLAVLKHMIHGPCGPNHRTDLPCWDQEKGKCNKRFPKQATDTTYVDQRGFIILKRNETNTGTITYRNRPITVNDQWVVPYNAALLVKYDCHVNLEVSSTRKIIKYLFKYMTKGPDEARVAIVPEEIRNDEVEQYVTKRYIGACDAAWRIFEFDLTARQPNVKQLTVHLEGRHIVFFRQGQESEAVEGASSDLLKYFNRPLDSEFDRLTYQDFYENYIIHASRPKTQNVAIHPICDGKYFVTKRQRKEMVARLFWVPISRGEQFYLRMLLGLFPCRSYADLYALGGPGCTTFQEAARAVGIANDEDEFSKCLEEAATFYTGKRLRHFFVLLITSGAPALILWDKFKHLLCEDFLERQQEDRAFNSALIEIDRLLRKHGSRVQDHGLPAVEDDTTELGRERMEYDATTLKDYVSHWVPLLSLEQGQVFYYVESLLTSRHPDDTPRALFLDGPSGTGKTLLLNVIVAYVRETLKGVALCTASSGIAAQNYEGGCTAHSMFRFPIDVVDDTGYWNLTNGTQRAELIRESSLIVYDEAPMAHKYLVHMLDRSLRDLMGSTNPFGGKIIIFAGDFRQIPPVVPSARCHNDVVQASLRTSPLWQHLTQFSLTEAQRTRNDEGYSDFILAIGSGTCESITVGTGRNAQSLLSLQQLNVVTEMADLLDFVFPIDLLSDPDTCATRSILCTLNANVREINAHILERVDGDMIHCYSVDSVDAEHAEEFHLGPDTLHKVQANGVPDYDLIIKKGCVCMIMRNLSFVDKLVNGTKVIVVSVTPRLVTVRKPTESETYLIPRISFKMALAPGSPIEMNRRQFPLQVCYAMTIHKSQGQTIERVGLDLRSDVFSHGQLYVALGRVRDKNNIKILINSHRFIDDDTPYTRNVVIRALIDY